MQPFELIVPLLDAALAASPTGDVCVPSWVVGAVGVGFSGLGGFAMLQWRAGQEKDRRTAEALERAQDQWAKSQERLFDVLQEAARKARSAG